MGERLIKPYEISVWEDKLTQDGEEKKFVENKIAVIGSNTMTGLNKVYNPVFNKKANGEKTLTFSLKYKYFDPYSGNSDFINPFAALLVNERKIKLHYDNEWYEFIIKDHSESSDGLEWTYSCTDAFVLELSKTGYNLTFDSELNNNQGTAAELAEKVLENTEWQFGGADTFKQLIAEPIYIAQLVGEVSIINVNGNVDSIPTPTTDIYIFYSYVKNKSGKYVQFIIRDDNKKYTIDDNNVITDTNFRITDDLTYDAEHNCFKKDDITVITIEGIENRYQANRLAYNQLTTYDPVMGRTVDRFAVTGDDREVYRYTDYEYTTSNIVMNYITNGENFNILEDGTLQGWNPYTDQEYEYNQVKNPGSNNPQEKGWYELVNGVYVLTANTTVQSGKTYYKKEQKAVVKLELITYPQLAAGKQLADLNILSQVEGYLKTTFNGPYQVVDGNIVNTVYNSGIDNQASFINSISKGDKFVFRWRAGEGELGQLTPVKTLGLIIARYDQDTPTRFGYYYKHIKEEDIIVHFTARTSSAELPTANNIIEGGALVTEGGVENYVIDNVVQTPSTKYLYKSGSDLYAWDGITGNFIEESQANYLPYYYTIAEANQSVPNTVLTNSDSNIGIFIYTSEIKTTTTTNDNEQITTVNPIYIQDIQLTRFVKDEAKSTNENPYPVLIGNIPTATSQPVKYYYFQPEQGAAAEDVETYASAEKLEQRFGLQQGAVTPKYNENSEKTLSISASQSNCFDILQTIAETFECWVDLVVEHDPDTGYIVKDGNNLLKKYVYLREYVGKDNWAGFKYGINLSSIERTVNSDEIVTKLIVDQSQSDYVDEGFVSIASAPSNTSGEAYILNFDYYYNQGLLNRTEVEVEKNSFAKQVADLNRQIQEKDKTRIQLENSLIKLQSNRTVFTELVSDAQDNLTQGLEKFKELTGYEYEEYREKYGEVLEEIPTEEIFDTTEDEGDEHTCVLQGKPVEESDITITVDDTPFNFEGGKEEEKTGAVNISYDGESTFVVTASLNSPYIHIAYVVDVDDLTEEETILDVLGQLYACSSTINNYSGLLTNINEEYWALRKQLRGNENYSVKYWKVEDDLHQWHICVDVSDYLLGFKFKLGYGDTVDDTWSTYDVTISKKYFDIEPVNHETVKVQFIVPDGFVEIEGTYLFEEVARTKAITATNPQSGIKDEIEELQKAKDQLTNNFNNKYHRFIQEGTWNSTDYIDSELYYLDALQVSNTSAQPQVTYTINVVEISELEGLEPYKFDAGDKTYVEDTEFFGWSQVNVGTEAQPQYVLTPAQEEVIVSEVEWHLEKPDENTITVQNYKTRFEDFFQRISAAVQTVQYNEATYTKISTLLDANGTINQSVLLQSLNNLAGQDYALTSNGSVRINGDNILIQNLTNQANRVIINSEGIRVSSDGGNTWTTAINGQGINIGAVYTGTLNTNEVIIGSKDSPSFRWDAAGISAYKSKQDDTYDLQTYVRYDEYGLYGIKEGGAFKAQNLQDVLDKAHFAVTWDGFFIKNSYEDGGRVSITSDNDFQVIDGTNTERIKIGSLGIENNERIYGINISDKNGNSVLSTDNNGNLTVQGTINAQAGVFSGLVNVGTGNPYIKIDGINSSIGTSNYQDGAGSGWRINANGDAVFNNITARGAIKTAVFEYAEIEAVGGMFIFRPSSTIKSAYRNGNDIIVQVEKPFLFAKINYNEVINPTGNPKTQGWYERTNYGYKVTDDTTVDISKTYYVQIVTPHSWAKISNYTNDGTEPNIYDILATNGLTHVYEISDVNFVTKEVTLKDAAATNAFIDSVKQPGETEAEVLLHLEGGALIDMGRKSDDSSYDNGIHNYGIGINSSDNTVNLPARAITLFETVVDETQEPKVTYDYRGILGTLPQLNNDKVSIVYSNYMQGKQGIYTDNMYIGNADKYIAFYKYTTTNPQTGVQEEKTNLRLVADEFIISSDDSDLVDLINNSVYETAVEYCLSTSMLTNTHSTVWTNVMPSPTSNYPYIWQRTKTTYNDGTIKYIPDDGGIGDGFYVESASGGSPGEDAMTLTITSSNGEIFRTNSDTSVLTVVIFKGATEITSQNQLDNIFGENRVSLVWYWKNMGDSNFTPVPIELLDDNGFTFNIDGTMVSISTVFQCELIYSEE